MAKVVYGERILTLAARWRQVVPLSSSWLTSILVSEPTWVAINWRESTSPASATMWRQLCPRELHDAREAPQERSSSAICTKPRRKIFGIKWYRNFPLMLDNNYNNIHKVRQSDRKFSGLIVLWSRWLQIWISFQIQFQTQFCLVITKNTGPNGLRIIILCIPQLQIENLKLRTAWENLKSLFQFRQQTISLYVKLDTWVAIAYRNCISMTIGSLITQQI